MSLGRGDEIGTLVFIVLYLWLLVWYHDFKEWYLTSCWRDDLQTIPKGGVEIWYLVLLLRDDLVCNCNAVRACLVYGSMSICVNFVLEQQCSFSRASLPC